MNNYLYQLLIVLCSSGVLGTIVTAISKKRERQSTANIAKAVDNQTVSIQKTIKSVQENQAVMVKTLEEMTNQLKTITQEQTELKKSFRRFRKESEDMDLLLIKKLKEKKIFNGESDELYSKILEYKNEEQEVL